MSEIAIRVENLGKKYVIGHQPSEKYTALRDVIANQFKGLGQKLFQAHRQPKESLNSEDFWALKTVSFDIKEGERVGIIGRNGAGKSTLLKILSRITEPTNGRITLKGRVASLLEVGTGFHPELTGRENIFLNGAILGMSKAEIQRKFDEIVAFAEVEKFLDTPVKRYSSGMYVRLAFAVAAHLEPEILVVDEVLAVGDIQFQKKCLGKMEDVAKQGRTVLFVSHNMAAIRGLCQSGYWLDKGQIRAQGGVNEVVDLYEKDVLSKASCPSGSTAINSQYGIEINRVKVDLDSQFKTTVLRITIEGKAQQLISRMGVGIRLTTSEGILVSNIWPRMAKSFLEQVYGSWNCTFEYPNINHYLASGDYVVHITLNQPQIGAILKLEDAALVQIPPIDLYDAGIYFNLHQNGIVPLPVNFLFKEA